MFNLNRPYVRNWQNFFTPFYIQGENYSFYYNEELRDTDLYSYEFWLIKPDGTHVSLIPGLSAIFISGVVGYNLYNPNFVFPYVADGQYYFQIYNTLRGREVFRSNLITVNAKCIYTTTRIKFRHNDQLYGVRYDIITNFWQMMRVPICQVGPVEVRSDRQQYRQSANGRELVNSKSFRDLVFKLEFYWADDIDFQAVSAMLEHSDIIISGNIVMNMSQIKIEKPAEQSRLSKGTFEIIVDDYNRPFSLDTYGEGIVYGGGAFADFRTYLIGN